MEDSLNALVQRLDELSKYGASLHETQHQTDFVLPKDKGVKGSSSVSLAFRESLQVYIHLFCVELTF